MINGDFFPPGRTADSKAVTTGRRIRRVRRMRTTRSPRSVIAVTFVPAGEGHMYRKTVYDDMKVDEMGSAVLEDEKKKCRRKLNTCLDSKTA